MNNNRLPLAARMRPISMDEFLGQEEVVGKGKMLRKAIGSDRLPSMIFWGPPGSGKTTLAFIIAQATHADFVQISATASGKNELREIIKRAEQNLRLGQKTILFIDEIHRWNKAQQDALLPHVERGTIVLIGATTENPSFEVIGALLSRCLVFVLTKLSPGQIAEIIKRAIKDKSRGLGETNIKIGKKEIEILANMSNGDARIALNVIEYASSISNNITAEIIREAFQKSHLLYDKDGEEHYNIISALHKSMRGGDANAALYWLGRMLEAGEDPLFVARRLIRFASEDIGLANSKALEQAVAAYRACHYIGMPECNVILAQAVVYMAKCQKSNELYTAYKKAQDDVKEYGNLGVPLHLRNAPTKLMKNLGYGKDYKYSPDYDYQESQEYLPPELKDQKYLN
ncbi:AAA family ATPase [Candidatus Kuenenbacteria bacterium RIFCSPHIGHO2_02_FULL_39_13]|uniref:AAA family ATPase n=1 Tax=Candidatus Kuenenbacteria bacterium RIFCSPHIGHO2_02_FULL_39_13 TaxID=1798561 RepID=A0A1F6FNX8_9BACT|nr:MAG: AAA family ATPase [Candidatus Kuenenbacteria bacterium RIFCSPHIGHO2_02_FULL_39_13]